MLNTLYERNHWLYLAVILLVSVTVFYPSLSHDFVNWDDGQVVRHNPIVHKGLSGDMLKEAFTTSSVHGQYYPLTITSFALNHALDGLNPVGYHAGNVLFHLLNVVVLFLIMLRLFDSARIAAVVVLLFAIHPMHVEPVAWVASRKDVLYLFWMLLAWSAYIHYVKADTRKALWFTLSLICMALSVLSKVAGIILPAVLLATDYLLGRSDWKQMIWEKIPFGLIALAFVVLGYLAQNASDAVGNPVGMEPLFYGSYTFVTYVVMSIFPHGLSAYHPFPALLGAPLPWQYYAAVVPAVILLGLAIGFGRKNRKIAFGAAIFIFSILPFLQFVPVGSALLAERFSYFPYVGLFVLMALGANDLITRYASPKIAAWKWDLALLALTVPFILMSIQQLKTWENGGTLWSNVIETYPEEPIPYMNRADYYRHIQAYELSFNDLTACIQMDPTFSRAYNDRGLIHLNTQNYEPALLDFHDAIRFDSQDSLPLLNRGLLYGMLGKDSLAILDYSACLRLYPSSSQALLARARLFLKIGNRAAAQADAHKAMKLGANLTPQDRELLER